MVRAPKGMAPVSVRWVQLLCHREGNQQRHESIIQSFDFSIYLFVDFLDLSPHRYYFSFDSVYSLEIHQDKFVMNLTILHHLTKRVIDWADAAAGGRRGEQ